MFQRLTRLMAAAFFLASVAGCSWVRDNLDGCLKGFRVQFTVDGVAPIPTKGAQSVTDLIYEVNDVSLFVFDSEGTYVGRFGEDGDVLKQNGYAIDVPVGPGRYKVVAWTGADKENYELSSLREGVSGIKDLELLVSRDENNRQDNYLHPVWHGIRTDIEVLPGRYPSYSVELKKINKNFVLVLQDMKGNSIKGDTFTYEIQSANGRMGYDASLLRDDVINYGAYLVESEDLSSDAATGVENPQVTYSVARAELNTTRLHENNRTRLVVRERATGTLVLDIDLIRYILLTRERYEGAVGRKLTDQEYLDAEDSFSLMFVMMPTGSIVNPYALVEFRINGWVVRLQDAIL